MALRFWRVMAANEFVEFVNKAVTPFHAVSECSKMLTAAGFRELREADAWQIEPMQKYFLTRNGSALVAFAVGGQYKPGDGGFSVVAAHTDSPCLKVKPRSKMSAQGCLQVAVSNYGGALFRTWFDRDLTLAGRVFVKCGDRVEQRLVNVDRPILYIPNLCIHLDRDSDRKFEFNREDHLRPILATELINDKLKEFQKTENTDSAEGTAAMGYSAEMLNDHHDALLRCLKQAANVNAPDEHIVDFELDLVDTQKAQIGGLHNEFISGARLDNLVGTYTAVRALLESLKSNETLEKERNIRIAACYDNEECGSDSAQGAGTALTEWILRRLSVVGGTNPPADAFERAIARSMLVSADQAHAVHPNYAAKHEERHRPLLHSGIVVKMNANQRYASTAVTVQLLRSVAERASVPLQKFVVRNDSPCGSTIGPILSTRLGLRTVDVGTAQLAMHSAREFADTTSIEHAIKLYTAFYEHLPDVWDKTQV